MKVRVLVCFAISDGALDLVGAEAPGTDVHMARSTVDDRLDALDIGLPHSVGTSVGMGDLDTKRHALAANIALCHWLHLQSVEKSRNGSPSRGAGCYHTRNRGEMQAKNKKFLNFPPGGLKHRAFSNIMRQRGENQ